MSKWTKQTYETVAASFRQCREELAGHGYDNPRMIDIALESVDDMAMRLADSFAADNPRFDRVRFLRACGTLSLPEYNGGV